MPAEPDFIYGLIKPAHDAHTLGIQTVADLLGDCRYPVVIADGEVAKAAGLLQHEVKRRKVLDWLVEKGVQRLGISYRLDEGDAIHLVGHLVEAMKNRGLFAFQGGPIDLLFFAGLPGACESLDRIHGGLVVTFRGGETPSETLLQMGIPQSRVPQALRESSRYDQARLEFGRAIVDSGRYAGFRPPDRSGYQEFGSRRDTVVKRLEAGRAPRFQPLTRAHVGPYDSSASRPESVEELVRWSEELAASRLLDILSIGTSQLTQSHFGEDWDGLPNGGGVPINSPKEYLRIYEAARPMLVRTYAGTRDIPGLAAMHEETLNMAWHALSLWWFNRLDGRGPLDLYTNLVEHLQTLDFIAQTGKPFEANVPHHFAFRGADDLTYLVSAYLAALLAKKKGIRTFILQNMLNTPRLTWGIADLAKSRALLALLRPLEDRSFRILLQPRAGLDYFKPDPEEARAQLAAVTALMDDIEPYDETSPPLLHVVSYSEASHLATPSIVKESIQITQHALETYRDLRRRGEVDDMGRHAEVRERAGQLLGSARAIIEAIEASIPEPYSAEGFYKIFAAGFLPVPYLWGDAEEFLYARNWVTRAMDGGIRLIDDRTGQEMAISERCAIAQKNLKEAGLSSGRSPLRA